MPFYSRSTVAELIEALGRERRTELVEVAGRGSKHGLRAPRQGRLVPSLSREPAVSVPS